MNNSHERTTSIFNKTPLGKVEVEYTRTAGATPLVQWIHFHRFYTFLHQRATEYLKSVVWLIIYFAWNICTSSTMFTHINYWTTKTIPYLNSIILRSSTSSLNAAFLISTLCQCLFKWCVQVIVPFLNEGVQVIVPFLNEGCNRLF